MVSDVGASVRPPATAVGDTAEFLDVNVDELTRSAGLDTPAHPPGGTIEGPQLMQPLAVGVIGGFVLSGPIVLLVLPSLYRLLDPAGRLAGVE